VKAGAAGEVRAGDYVCLAIGDTGLGMDRTTLQRAVEPFFSTKGVGKGTGLGLSMVHGLALQLGGGLTINSTHGAGTEVALWLPISDRPLSPEQTLHSANAKELNAGLALLVDDEELVRSATADMLTELGYEVVEAASGNQALQLMDSGLKPDLLITDHLMPGMTGSELAARCSAREPSPKVLLISGYAEDIGIEANMARLHKPFRQAELTASLASLEEPRA
jgi:CheY-like chemotaxis protein